MLDFEFVDACAVVSGGGSGIGRSMVLEFAQRGAQVIVADINGDSAVAVASEVANAGGTAVSFKVDVAEYDSVAALAEYAYDTFGKVDLLCNNAGVSWRPLRATWNARLSDFRWLTEVNYFGTVHGIMAFLPRMRAQSGRRHIVNTSSMVTMALTPGHAPYAASKAAVDGLSDTLRAELEDDGAECGLTVLYPGMVSTDLTETSRTLRAYSTGEDIAGAGDIAYVQKRNMKQPYMEPKGPDHVGWQVAEAIVHNDPYCLTHPAFENYLRERTQSLVRGYRGR